MIPAITHVDGSGRLQTVSRETNPRYWQLINAFERLTGVPMLLNTSFNENEPIVLTPDEALDCFLRTQHGRAGHGAARPGAMSETTKVAASAHLLLQPLVLARSGAPPASCSPSSPKIWSRARLGGHGGGRATPLTIAMRERARRPNGATACTSSARAGSTLRPEPLRRPRHELPHLLRVGRRQRASRPAAGRRRLADRSADRRPRRAGGGARGTARRFVFLCEDIFPEVGDAPRRLPQRHASTTRSIASTGISCEGRRGSSRSATR